MKFPCKKQVRIKFNDEQLKHFIKDLLCSNWQWKYKSLFQELTIDLHVLDIQDVRKDVLEWLIRSNS